LKKLVDAINLAAVPEAGIEDWDGAVRKHLGPYVRRKSIFSRDRELLRAELLNLAKIEPFSECTTALRIILGKYRAAIRAQPAASLGFLANRFEEIARADEHWMNLFMSQEPIPEHSRPHDHAFRIFTMLDSILEGCYKLHLRVVFGFASHSQTGHFPADAGSADFGQLCSPIEAAYSWKARFLVEDPANKIAANQWRNIAAHKSFMVVSESALEVRFGKGSVKTQLIAFSALGDLVEWARRCLDTTRLANVIICLEYLKELKDIGIPDTPIRLESFLTMLCHNLGIVGLECRAFDEEQESLVVTVQDRLGRNFVAAIIHASQVLDQISTAVEQDRSTAQRLKRAEIRLVDLDGKYIASASIRIEDALDWSLGKLTMKERLAKTQFDFADNEAVRDALLNLSSRAGLTSKA
jgi:hypothetical protein